MAEHEVVIAGGGPTGMMLAAELALAKVDVAVIGRVGTPTESRPAPARRRSGSPVRTWASIGSPHAMAGQQSSGSVPVRPSGSRVAPHRRRGQVAGFGGRRRAR
jgi:2-polyprenyl-6-methoxyphenol hydroxylase-like FAD-dependent oxidoreductase